MESSLSAADIVAMTRETADGGHSDWMNNPFIYLVWLALLGNGNMFGNRNGVDASESVATASDLFEGFNNQDVNGQLRGITQGLCDGFYAINTGILQGTNSIQNSLCQGFNGVNSGISNLGYQMSQCCCDTDKAIMQNSFQNQAGFNTLGTQLAQCCCDIKYDMASQFCDTRNTIQNVTRDIIDNQNCNTRAILDFMVQTQIAEKDAQIAELQRAASQDRQNALLTTAMTQQTAQLINAINPPAVPAYVVPNPNTCGCNSNFNWGCGCGGCC